MKLKRYYYSDRLNKGEVVVLGGEEFHHMANVMRTRVGEQIELFCGDGYDYIGVVEELNKKDAKIFIQEQKQNLCNPNVQIDVFQALAKGDKLSLITQKITELGAHKLVIFESKFCDVKGNTGKLDKLSSVTISACKQCGRSVPVEIEGVVSLSDIEKMTKDYDKFLLFYEAEDGNTLKAEIEKLSKQNAKKIAIMVGPEGGFEKGEIEELKNSGATIVGLGNRIMRTETASIAGVAVLSQLFD